MCLLVTSTEISLWSPNVNTHTAKTASWLGADMHQQLQLDGGSDLSKTGKKQCSYITLPGDFAYAFERSNRNDIHPLSYIKKASSLRVFTHPRSFNMMRIT